MTTATRTILFLISANSSTDLRQRGTHFKLRVLEDEQAPVCTFDGKQVINLASNNYLGLTTHPKLREAALEATRKYGVGSGAVRTIAGTMTLHMELEEKIAALQERRSLRGVPVGLHGECGNRVGDSGQRRLHHLRRVEPRLASSTARGFRAPRSRSSATKTSLMPKSNLPASRIEPGHKLLITDGVFSMDGDIGPLPGALRARREIRRHHDGRRRALPPASSDATAAARSTTSTCTAVLTFRSARFRRRSARSADTSAARAT